MLRSRIGVFLGIVVMAVLATLAGAGVASASADRVEFVEQARAAGLSAEKAAALQAKVDNYLVTLKGTGTQVSPNQIDLNGAVLNVAVPGEERPRQLVPATRAEYRVYQCDYFANYEWYCAYEYEYRNGDNIGMWECGIYYIPWFTTGSYENNQTPGTRPVALFTDGNSWVLPPAYAIQQTGVNWAYVYTIKNC